MIHLISTYFLLSLKEAKKIIEEHDKSKPMFLYLAFMAVHTPFVGVPPRKFRQMISNKARKDTFEESPHDLRDMVLASVDEAIDKVIVKLKETGIYNNSVILVTTDNGGGEVEITERDNSSPAKVLGTPTLL